MCFQQFLIEIKIPTSTHQQTNLSFESLLKDNALLHPCISFSIFLVCKKFTLLQNKKTLILYSQQPFTQAHSRHKPVQTSMDISSCRLPLFFKKKKMTRPLAPAMICRLPKLHFPATFELHAVAKQSAPLNRYCCRERF